MDAELDARIRSIESALALILQQMPEENAKAVIRGLQMAQHRLEEIATQYPEQAKAMEELHRQMSEAYPKKFV